MASSIKRAAIAVVAGFAAFIGLVLVPGTAAADPDTDSETTANTSSLSELQQQILSKQHELSVINEQYLDAKIALDTEARKADQAAQDLKTATAKSEAAAVQVGEVAASAYKGSQIASLSAMISSGSPQEVLDRLNTLDAISAHNGEVLAELLTQQQKASTAKDVADNAKAVAAKTEKQIAEKKAKLEKEVPELEQKLAQLTAAQRAQVLNAGGGAPAESSSPTTKPIATGGTGGSAAAQGAVAAALSRQGMPYVWAAAGPSAFDCSGLTMWAYAQVGISLPHSSSAQRGSGPSVSFSALAPGDLVFMPGHVGMYIGNGMVVHAPTTGDVVKVVPLSSMNWSYANRPAG